MSIYTELGDALDQLDPTQTALVALQFEVAISTVRKWREMTARPHPLLAHQILDYVRELIELPLAAYCDADVDGSNGSTRDCMNDLPCKNHPPGASGNYRSFGEASLWENKK